MQKHSKIQISFSLLKVELPIVKEICCQKCEKIIYPCRANKSEKGTGKSGSGINDYVTSLFDQSLTWKDIEWLKKITHLPIIVKGILHPEDAKIGRYKILENNF